MPCHNILRKRRATIVTLENQSDAITIAGPIGSVPAKNNFSGGEACHSKRA
jgi:hypothetical protein